MQERLFQLLSKVFDMEPDNIHVSLTKDDIYKWDSLVQMELVTTLENNFNIQLTVDDIISMNSVKKIIDVLCQYGVPINVSN